MNFTTSLDHQQVLRNSHSETDTDPSVTTHGTGSVQSNS